MRFLIHGSGETVEMQLVKLWEYYDIAAAQAVPIGNVRRDLRFARLVHAASPNHAAIDDAILQLSRTVASRKNESEVALFLQVT